MKNNIFKRILSAFLATVMVFIMIPFSAISIIAAGTEVSAGDGGYIGKSYNALGNTAFSEDALSLDDIFIDTNALDFETRGGKSETEYTYALVTDFSSYAHNQIQSLDSNIDFGAKIKIIKLGASAKYGMKSSVSSSGEQSSEYIVMEVTHIQNTHYMNVSNLKNLWTEENSINPEFITAINTMEAAEFFARYGTHIVTGYSTGGTSYASYEGNSIVSNNSSSSDHNKSLEASVDAGGFFDVKGKLGISEHSDDSASVGNTTATVKSNTIGGNGHVFLTKPELSNDNIDDFVNDFIDSIDRNNARIIVDDNLKMLSVWDFIYASGDASLYSAAQAFEEYYYEHIDGENEQIGGYSNDWLNYPDCKIITTPEEFNNIRNDLDGVYVLACNIDLSAYENWEPIGSKLNPFTGRFYGNSNTISGLNITSCTDNIAGLFGYNNGTIHGVRVEGSIVADSVSSIGGIAAQNNGIISDCFNAVDCNVRCSGLELRRIRLEENSPQTITIGNEKGIYLIGEPGITYTGINIVVENSNEKSPAYIVLENAGIVGNSNSSTVYSSNNRPIYIVSTGYSNDIAGGQNSIAINTPNADVSFFGSARLMIFGGRGEDGITYSDIPAEKDGSAPSGTNGADGCAALICNSVKVNMFKASLSLFGGDGGNGGNGSSFSSKSNLSGEPKLSSGGNGGNGGNGGQAIITPSNIEDDVEIISCTSFYSCPGDGGHGGAGGEGCSAHEYNDNHPDNGGNGGHGGHGGNGFIAGNGGDGGKGGFSYGTDFWNESPALGKSGDGGNGGNSGIPMIAFNGSRYYIGEVGVAGAAGSYGDTDPHSEKNHASYGSMGAPGKVLSATYDESIEDVRHSTWEKVTLSVDSVYKTNYFSGDEFDKSTISVSSNGEEVYYDYSFNSQRIGINYVKINDGNCTRLIPVYVTETVPTSIEIVEPGKVEFVKNTSFVVEGLKIKAIYNNGSEAYFDENSEGISWTEPNLASEGSKTVTVFYDYDSDATTPALEATYTINVVRVSVTHIEVDCPPIDVRYAPNEEFNPKGLVIEVFRNDGSAPEKVDATSNELKYIYDFSVAGSCSVIIDYYGYTTYVECTVTAHAFGDWYTVEEADHNKEGLERRDCSYATSEHINCFETRVIPKVAHTFDKEVTTDVYKKSDATFTSPAIYYYSCECGAKGSETFTHGTPLENENAPHIVVDSKNAVVGKTVTVKISLLENPGITSMKINVAYDSALLTLTDVEYNTAMGGQSVLPESIVESNGNVVLYWVDGFVNYENNGVFATLTFTVSDNAVIDSTTSIVVTYDAEDIYDANENNVAFICDEGVLTFVEYTPGDINGDGVLNSKDTTRLMRYLAGWDVDVNEAALDVNGDGAVNGKDTTRLMRYLANWDVEIN